MTIALSNSYTVHFAMPGTTTINQLKYLKRINYRGVITNSVDVLTKLQQSHLLSVPFENLDIHAGRRIELENSYDKIVNRRRGGFCYELNGLFYQLLEGAGFDVKLISARVYRNEQEFSPEFDHMAIIARIDNDRYLVDVGFGEFAYSPIKIEFDLLQPDREGNFVIKRHDDAYLSVGKLQGDNFTPEYIFTEASRQLSDFTEMCNFHQTSSLSHFTQKRLCSIVTEKGRTTISGNKLKKNEYGEITETELAGEEDFNKALWDFFKIRM